MGLGLARQCRVDKYRRARGQDLRQFAERHDRLLYRLTVADHCTKEHGWPGSRGVDPDVIDLCSNDIQGVSLIPLGSSTPSFH